FSVEMSGDEGDSMDVRRSSRSRVNKRTETKKSALELLKEARRSGKSHKPENDTVANVYEEVDEDEYNDIVKQRQHDDFVIDDDGAGYVDHGADIFDDDEEDIGERKRKQKKDKENKPKKGGISSFFAAANVTKTKAKDDNDIKLEDDDDVDAMLAEAEMMDATETPSRNPFKRQAAAPPSPDHIAPKAVKRNRLSMPLSTAASPKPATPAATAAAAARQATFSKPAAPMSPPAKRPAARAVPSFDEDDFDTDLGMDVDEIVGEIKMEEVEEEEMKPEPVQNKEQKVEEKKIKEEKRDNEKEMVVDDWNVEEDKESVSTAAAVQQGSETFYREIEGKKTIRMFWIDAYEDFRNHPGTVYLFGRVFTSHGRSSSICIKVENIRRQIFVLPRQQDDGTPFPMVDVYNEVKTLLMDTHGVNEVKCRPVKRKFINDGTVAESSEPVDVMEVQYHESKSSRLNPSHEGTTFTRVYNATTTSMERLLVECRMKGPGWIDVANYVPASSKESYCTYQFNLDMGDDLKGVERPKNLVYDTATTESAPPIRMMCLNVVTALNEKKEPEILALSYLLNTAASMENPTTDKRAFRKKAFVCTPPLGVALPFDLQKKLGEKGLKDCVQIFPKEKALIGSFLNSLSREENEPDCYVGHDLQATISLLMARCEKHGIPVWSKLSRLNRSITAKKLGHSKSAHWEITAGRLLLDSRAAAMELVHSRNYDLTELCSTLLGEHRAEVHPHEVIGKFCGNSASLISLLLWSWSECHRPLAVLAQIQALPLFRGITNICGGVMSRTLLGGRAERNELLLLHAFSLAGLIAPDKYQHVFAQKKEAGKGKGKKDGAVTQSTQGETPEEGGEKEGTAIAPIKGSQYLGGLVLDPKKGLYDTLVLLLDFNSLYPSIIQEYNICFTTIRHEKNGDAVPEAPIGATTKGILPTQIENLVTQRYEVKKVMANERNPEKKKQYDIRQKALKLTANSMYGCLGFAQSRFYAKPLAALVTSKGREILQETKNLVERLGHEVIYGDTDSIMVNTGDIDEEKAKRIGKEISKTVNKLRAKLELEHEGTFRRMLLLKKKKYAALTIEAGGKLKKELKGLDIVRRDWSMLAKNVGSDVVDIILNPSLSREELVSQIDDRLMKLKRDLDEGNIELDCFSIFKSLTRDPAKYEDVKQSHATVAKRMNESGQKSYKQGDIVEYVICEDGTTHGHSQRAYHRQEMKANEGLKIDLQYYLAQQVHPVVSRLCEPIEELDSVRIAELLGLDGAQFRRRAVTDDNVPVWQETFEHCEGIKIICPACKHNNEIREIFRGEGMDRRAALDCCENCNAHFYENANCVVNQFNRQLSSLVEKEQTAFYVCEDVVCAARMRSFPMRVTRDGLECPKCRTSFMHKEYTSKTLFEQQTFFGRILDLLTAVKAIKNNDQKTTIQYRPGFIKVEELSEVMKRLNDSFMSRNTYNIVDLCFVFGPMMAK
ncbi:hypothetical protein PFISCL1PPCAC_19047, partial [Pristionchus fissidentatus]